MLSISNYNKPSHPIWQRIGDVCIYGIMLYNPIIMSLPISMILKLWITSSMTFVSSTIKLISKFTLDPDYEPQDNMDISQQSIYPISNNSNTGLLGGTTHPVL